MTQWVAHLAFAVLLAAGLALGELGLRGVLVSVLLWLTGRALLAWLGWPLFPAYVAVLDTGLVLTIFKGDIRLR